MGAKVHNFAILRLQNRLFFTPMNC